MLADGMRGAGGAKGEPWRSWVVDGVTAEGKRAFFDSNALSYCAGRNFGGVHLGARLDGRLVGVLYAQPPGRAIGHGTCAKRPARSS